MNFRSFALVGLMAIGICGTRPSLGMSHALNAAVFAATVTTSVGLLARSITHLSMSKALKAAISSSRITIPATGFAISYLELAAFQYITGVEVLPELYTNIFTHENPGTILLKNMSAMTLAAINGIALFKHKNPNGFSWVVQYFLSEFLLKHVTKIKDRACHVHQKIVQTIQHIGDTAYESKAGEIVRDRLQQLENYRHGKTLTLQSMETAFRQHLLNNLAAENPETDMSTDNLNVPRAIQSIIVENLAKNSRYVQSAADEAIPSHRSVIDPEILNKLTFDEFELLEAFTVVLQDRARNPENARLCIHPTPKQLQAWRNLQELLDNESKDLLSDLISYR